MRYSLATAILVSTLVLPLGAASAQNFSNDVIARCAQVVGQYKFEGYPAERNREMMMLACQSNGGSIPGTNAEKPVSLPRGARQR
jgi:hypothetical protein